MEIKVRKSLRVMGCALVAVALTFALAPAQSAHAASKPAKVKSVNVSKVKTTSAKVTWKKAASKSVKGYQVRVYKGKKTFKTYTVKGRKATSKTVTKLKANTKYSAKVRAYKGSKHKKYGKWSSAKKFTTKKVAKKPTTSKPNNTKPSNGDSNSNSNSNSNANSGKNDSSTHLHVWQRSKTHNEPWYTEYLAKHSWVEYVPVKVKRYEITETQYDCAICRDFPEYADSDVGWQNVGAGHFWKEHQSTLKEAIASGEAINIREVVLQEAGEEIVTDNPQYVIKCECGKEIVSYAQCLNCGEYVTDDLKSGEHSANEHKKCHPSVSFAYSTYDVER